MDDYEPYASPGRAAETHGAKSRGLWYFAGGCGVVLLLCCGVVFAGLAYLGARGPNTSVYTGNQVLREFDRDQQFLEAIQERLPEREEPAGLDEASSTRVRGDEWTREVAAGAAHRGAVG